MNRCLIARAMGAAAGGLLGSAFVPMAVAFADDYAIVPDPSSVEEVTGIYGSGFFGVPQLPHAVDGLSYSTLTTRPSVLPPTLMSSGPSRPTRLALPAAWATRNFSSPPTFLEPWAPPPATCRQWAL